MADAVLRYYDEPRLDPYGKEFRQAISMVVVMYAVKQLPDEVTMQFIIDYMAHDAPKVSVNEFMQAFKWNAIGKLPKTECYGAITIEFISSVLSSYAITRGKLIYAQRVALPETSLVQPKSWWSALCSMNEIPYVYNWKGVFDELLKSGAVTNDDLANEISLVRKHYRHTLEGMLDRSSKSASHEAQAKKNIILRLLKNEKGKL